MSAHATQPERDDPGHQAPNAQAPNAQAATTQRHHQVLDGLVNMGADFARLLHGQALLQAQPAPQADQQPPATHPTPAPAAPPAPATLVSLAAAFGAISRSVRRCIMLAQALANPKQPAAADPARHRTTARKRIIREVEDAIHRQANEGASADHLTAELRERLDAPDLEDDISSRPVADIVKELCRDLGLFSAPNDPQWKRRTPASIEQLCARAAQPSRPRPPGARPQDAEPQDAGPSTAQPSPAGPPPGLKPNGHPAASPQPADPLRAPGNLQIGHHLPRHWPDDPAEPAAPQSHARNGDRWRPT